MPSWARSPRAVPSGKKGCGLPRRLRTPRASCCLWGIGLLALRQGDLPRALPLLERAMGICQEADLPGYFPRMAAALGAAYTLGGRVADAVPLLTQAMEQTTATEMVDFQALCRLSLGEAQLLAGRLEEAHALAERALAHAREHQERGHRRMPCASSATLRRGAIRRMSKKPKPTTDRPSPWPKNSACARWLPIATMALVPCMPSSASGSKPVPNCPPPSSCTAPWR